MVFMLYFGRFPKILVMSILPVYLYAYHRQVTLNETTLSLKKKKTYRFYEAFFGVCHHQLILKPECESHQRRRIKFEVLFSRKNRASELKTFFWTNEDKILEGRPRERFSKNQGKH